jgi:hypothetical protein
MELAEALLGQCLVLGAWTTVVGIGIYADATTGNEEACNLDILGIHEADEVFHDDVDTILMKLTAVAEGEEVELEALALYHALVWDIGYAYLGKVWLSRDGAERGELRTVELHPVVIVGMLVLECLEYIRSILRLVVGGLAAQKGQ